MSSAFAESYTDGIEYFKSGQPDRAKIILDKTLNDPSTKKAEAYFYLGEIYSGMNKLDSAGMYYDMGLQADPLYPYNSIGKGKLMLKNNKKRKRALRYMGCISESFCFNCIIFRLAGLKNDIN